MPVTAGTNPGKGGNPIQAGISGQSNYASNAGFTGDALAIILAIAACDSGGGGPIGAWTQAQYKSAWLSSKGGKDFSSFACATCSDGKTPASGICADGSTVPYAAYLNSVAHGGGKGQGISSTLQKLADLGQQQNQPGITTAIGAFFSFISSQAGWIRIAKGGLGVLLLVVALVLAEKQFVGGSASKYIKGLITK